MKNIKLRNWHTSAGPSWGWLREYWTSAGGQKHDSKCKCCSLSHNISIFCLYLSQNKSVNVALRFHWWNQTGSQNSAVEAYTDSSLLWEKARITTSKCRQTGTWQRFTLKCLEGQMGRYRWEVTYLFSRSLINASVHEAETHTQKSIAGSVRSEVVNIWFCLPRPLQQICFPTPMTWMLLLSVSSTGTA